MANGEDHGELLRTVMAVAGGVFGAVSVVTRLAAALITRETLRIEQMVVDRLAPRLLPKELLKSWHNDLSERVARLEERMDRHRDKS